MTSQKNIQSISALFLELKTKPDYSEQTPDSVLFQDAEQI